MNDPVEHHPDRRDILTGGVLLGVAGLLSACAGGRPNMPDAVWPGQAGSFDRASRPSTTPASPTPPRPVQVAQPTDYFGRPSNVIPRSRWTSQGIITSRLTSNGDSGRMGRITRITVHHDSLDNGSIRSEGEAIRRLNLVRTGHVTRKPDAFADIGYHFAIDPQGRIWEARPLSYQGAHVKGQNENNMGIMLMGNFDYNRPTPAALATLEGFVVQQMRRYNISHGSVKTHQEMAATECPGRNLQRSMLAARNRGGRIYSA